MGFFGLFATATIAWIEAYFLKQHYLRLRKIEPHHYYSLSDLFVQRIKGSLLIQYAVFRFLPIGLILIFNTILVEYFLPHFEYASLITNYILIIMHALETNLSAIRNQTSFLSRMVHTFIFLVLITMPLLVELHSDNLEKYMPSGQGIIDNIWSALITTFLISFFIQERDEFVLEKDYLLKRIALFSGKIEKESEKYSADINLVKAIAIFESLQRPKFIRRIEWLLARYLKKEITQGIMQVRHAGYISDEESIEIAVSKYLSGTSKLNDDCDGIEKVLHRYNPSSEYARGVIDIYWAIKY